MKWGVGWKVWSFLWVMFWWLFYLPLTGSFAGFIAGALSIGAAFAPEIYRSWEHAKAINEAHHSTMPGVQRYVHSDDERNGQHSPSETTASDN